jgi:hypothetical protein
MNRIIDILVEAARKSGAESFDISLKTIRDLATKLDSEGNHKESSYDSELNYHTVNMKSRFTNPLDKNRFGPARWKDEPYFYKVGRGQYRLLTEDDKKIFKEAIKQNLDIVFEKDYEFNLLKSRMNNSNSLINKNIKIEKNINNSIDYQNTRVKCFESADQTTINPDLKKSLKELADLISEKNKIELKISKIINRPAIIGHAGEYIASKIFNIDLEISAVNKGIDGYFSSGILKGKGVNIKWYGKKENLLDITPSYLPDYYLVLTGPPAPAVSSRGKTRPWVITNIFLFKAKDLMENLLSINVKVGIATSVRSFLWDKAEIYPNQNNEEIILSNEQKEALKLFS